MQVIPESNRVSAPEKWVDIHTVCEHIGFSLRTVTEYINKGKLPGYPSGTANAPITA
jgi:hypothetical protein